jgi:hypothetical protein
LLPRTGSGVTLVVDQHVLISDPPTRVAGHLRQVDRCEDGGIDSEIARKFNSLLAYRTDGRGSEPP